MPPKGSSSKSKSPAPKAKSVAAASASPKRATSPPKASPKRAASPPKASPKRATSAAAKKTTPAPAAKKAASTTARSVSPKPTGKRVAASKQKDEDVASDVSEEIDVSEDLPPATQNQMSQSSGKKKSPSPKRAPSPKKASPVVATKSKAAATNNNQDAAQKSSKNDNDNDISNSIRQGRLAETHANPKAQEAVLEAVKRCSKVGVAVHSIFDYLKKKAADHAKKQSSSSSSAAADSVDDVLALFGPQKSSGIGAAVKNDKIQQSTAENNGIPVTQVAVEFSFIRAPKPHRVPWSVVLPNAVHDIEKSICLITPSPQEKFREQIEGDAAQQGSEDFVEAPSNIQKIMDVKKLEGRFQDPVALRALAKSYSAFWVHNEVDTFPRVLTGEFMSHHFPVWVNGKKSLHINERLQRTLGCVMIPRQGHDNVSIVVGHTKQSEAELVENIRTFCGNVVALLEESWKDVLSIRLSFKDFGSDRRINLPIYAHSFSESHGLGTASMVVPKILKVPTNARITEEWGKKTEQQKKEAGKIRQRDEEGKAGAEKKPSNSAADNNNNKKKSGAATPKPAQKKQQMAVAEKKNEDAAEVHNISDDDDDDEIPQIDASPVATNNKQKPASKGKKAGGKK